MGEEGHQTVAELCRFGEQEAPFSGEEGVPGIAVLAAMAETWAALEGEARTVEPVE